MDDGWLCRFLPIPTALQATESMGTGRSIFLEVLIILILILFNAFFAATEMAVVSLNDNAIKKEADEGSKKAKRLLRFMDNPGKFLATIQVGVTFAGFLSSSFAGKTFAYRMAYLINDNPSELVLNVSLILVTLIISYISIVIGELVPKQIALANPDGFAKAVGGLLVFFDYIFRPLTWLISHSAGLILRLLRINPDDYQQVATEEEIRMLLEQGSKSGSIHSEESQMIVNVFEFNDKEVSEIMTHRTNVIALDIDSDYQEAMEIAVHEKYSRIPVYEEDIDNIIGILNIKDLLYYAASDSNREKFNLRTLIREPYWVPESKNVDELFREMQREHVSMAVVIDEYGGTAGIVSIEDILEEIVGNIQDEYDEEDYDIKQVAENTYEMSGLLDPEDITRVLPDAYFPEDEEADYDTIAGLIISLLGRIPDDDEQAECAYRNMEFKVLSMDDKRIDRLQLHITETLASYEERQRQLMEEEAESKLEEIKKENPSDEKENRKEKTSKQD